MSENITISCPCLFGLESILAYEARKIGGTDVVVTDGKVTFNGTMDTVAQANVWLRTAERVTIVLGTFTATSFEQLFDQVELLPFEDFIGKKDAFPVKGWSLNSQLHSIPDCQSIIKRAAVKRLERVYHQTWFEETGPLHQIQFSIHKDVVTVMLDTTGAGLHKRGYRRNANEAPIKETLAAGIVDLARIKSETIVYDPFCGSGTLLIESALKAINIAPGIRRKFAAEQWSVFAGGAFEEARKQAYASIDRDAGFRAYGMDIDGDAVKLAADNAYLAGVATKMRTKEAGIDDFEISVPEGRKAVVLCNPPYGERMLEIEQAERLYKTMGKVFKPQENVSYYIISPHEDFERLFGRKADKRRKLYNGMIKCQLYMYFNSK